MYIGGDLARCSVGTRLYSGLFWKTYETADRGSRGVWPAQRPNDGEKPGSPNKLHGFEWVSKDRAS